MGNRGEEKEINRMIKEEFDRKNKEIGKRKRGEMQEDGNEINIDQVVN